MTTSASLVGGFTFVSHPGSGDKAGDRVKNSVSSPSYADFWIITHSCEVASKLACAAGHFSETQGLAGGPPMTDRVRMHTTELARPATFIAPPFSDRGPASQALLKALTTSPDLAVG